jgi:hypothetical protein
MELCPARHASTVRALAVRAGRGLTVNCLSALAAGQFGEQGVVDLVGTVGYFVAVCLVMNVAGTPPHESEVTLLR